MSASESEEFNHKINRLSHPSQLAFKPISGVVPRACRSRKTEVCAYNSIDYDLKQYVNMDPTGSLKVSYITNKARIKEKRFPWNRTSDLFKQNDLTR